MMMRNKVLVCLALLPLLASNSVSTNPELSATAASTVTVPAGIATKSTD